MTNHDATTTKPEKSWVWWCSKASIATGKTSLLAILETFAAIALYWRLAIHFDWSWMVFVCLFAAPMLLLRSSESIELGVEMLGKYYNRGEEDASKTEKTILFLIASLVIAVTAYFLTKNWLESYTGWSLFWRSIVLVVSMIAGTTALASASANIGVIPLTIMKGVSTAVSIAVVLLSLIALLASFYLPFFIAGNDPFMFITAIMFAGVVLRKGSDVLVRVSARVGDIAIAVATNTIHSMFYALGILLRSQLIRWFATLRHPLKGLTQLPKNWHETLLLIDLTHPPELIPQAGKVSGIFSVKSLLLGIFQGKTDNLLLFPTLILVYYFPALAYRWSLKASAWLWFPLALLLTPPLEGMDELERSERTTSSVKGTKWIWLRRVALAVLAWLVLARVPELASWLSLLPKEIGVLAEKLHALSPPPLGIRYVALCVFGVLGLWFADVCDQLKILYGKIIDEPAKISDVPTAQRDHFEQHARNTERLRIILIVTVIIGGYAFAADWMLTSNATNAALAQKFISPWLLQIL